MWRSCATIARNGCGQRNAETRERLEPVARFLRHLGCRVPGSEERMANDDGDGYARRWWYVAIIAALVRLLIEAFGSAGG